jgi:outer membrane receptor protein involved in Fe transport
MPVVHPKRPNRPLVRTPIASAVLIALASPALMAQDTDSTLGEVIVTAQKREQSLQDVPISIKALDQETLSELNIQDFKDYVQFLPTVTMAASDGAGSGFTAVYMRGIATGGDGQATTSQPSVGMYLDEQPITTIQGNLDVHLYDVARVEALAGPQGTLYGASSQAGTIRIITNKPDPSGFAASYALEGNYVDMEEPGYVAEGMVNLPLSDTAAIRLVGWAKHDAGWIDNIPLTRVYEGDPLIDTDDFTADNSEFAEDNYNTIDTVGARAQLRVNLGENWSVTPSLMYQKMEQEGSWADDLDNGAPERGYVIPGSQTVAHFREEFVDDEWYQVGLTVEGSIANFDVVYSGNFLDRDVDGAFDYSEYSYWYNDAYTYFTGLFIDDNGDMVDPSAAFSNNDQYKKTSHELRISTPQDKRVRGLLGFFYQKQEHDFYQEFGRLEGLVDQRAVNGFDPNATSAFPGVVYLNSMDREDTDQAVFATVSFDITDDLELSLGARYFEPEVTVKGFFGFGMGLSRPWQPGFGEDNIEGTPDDIEDIDEPGAVHNGGEGAYDIDSPWWGTDGEWRCASQAEARGGKAPCQNVDKGISESDSVYRVNLSWNATEASMLYATWSEGYRPGGVQRNPFAGEYLSDFLTNYELGWKTRWADDRLQFNGAIFLDEWDDIQVSFQGENGITQVDNGPSAEVAGAEIQLDWLPTDSFRLAASLAYYDSELKDDYCGTDFNDIDNDGDVTECAIDNTDPANPVPIVNAATGTPLPLTPEFKGTLVGRYSFPLGGWESYVQGAFSYQTSATSDLDTTTADLLGEIPSSTFVDLAYGLGNEKYNIELFLSNATDEDAPVSIASDCAICAVQPWGVQRRPRTLGIRFSQDF